MGYAPGLGIGSSNLNGSDGADITTTITNFNIRAQIEIIGKGGLNNRKWNHGSGSSVAAGGGGGGACIISNSNKGSSIGQGGYGGSAVEYYDFPSYHDGTGSGGADGTSGGFILHY